MPAPSHTTKGTREIAKSMEVEAHRLEQEAKALRDASALLRGRKRVYTPRRDR